MYSSRQPHHTCFCIEPNLNLVQVLTCQIAIEIKSRHISNLPPPFGDPCCRTKHFDACDPPTDTIDYGVLRLGGRIPVGSPGFWRRPRNRHFLFFSSELSTYEESACFKSYSRYNLKKLWLWKCGEKVPRIAQWFREKSSSKMIQWSRNSFRRIFWD
jgi:hypothetical protein